MDEKCLFTPENSIIENGSKSARDSKHFTPPGHGRDSLKYFDEAQIRKWL